jgi:hypothetical protein
MTTASPTLPTHQPSGRINVRLLLRALVWTLPLLAAAGWGYACLLLLNLPGVVAAFLALVFSVVCAVTIAHAAKAGHSRSVRWNTVLAVVLALFALWIRWLVTLRGYGVPLATEFVASGPLFFSVLWNFAVAQAAAPGAFSPLAHCTAWLAETVTVVGISVMVARNGACEPYSEDSQKWASKEALGELYLANMQSGDLLEYLAEHGPRCLLTMPRAADLQTSIASQWWTIAVEGFSTGADAPVKWLNITTVEQTRNDKGGINTVKRLVATAWPVSAEDYADIVQHMHHAEKVSSKEDIPSEVGSSNEQPRPTPSELESALAAYQAGQHADAIALASAHCQHPDPAVKADALRLCALCHCALLQWEQAFHYFHELFQYEATAHNALQLATTSVMCGELLRGQAWFEKAENLNATSREMPSPALRTSYMSALEQKGETAALMPHMEWFADLYASLSITDSHFLWARGVPFFSVFLEKSLPILRAHMAAADIPNWYAKMEESLDEEGRQALQTHIQTIS